LRRYFDRTGDYCFLIDESHNLPDRVRDMYSLEFSLSKLKEYARALARIESIKGILTDACRTFASVLYPLCKSETRITPSGERVACVSSASLPSSLHTFFASLKQKCERFYFARRADLTREEYKVIRELLSTLRSALDSCTLYGSGHRTIVQRKDSELCVKILCIDPSGIITKRLECGKSAVMFSATLLPTEYYHTLLTGGRNALSVDIPSPFDKDNLCIAVLDSISTRYSDREQNAHAICNAIFTTVSAKKGNYMVFCPSFSYMEYIHSVFCSSYPSVSSIMQKRSMTMRERSEFLASFKSAPNETLVAFCVMGGIYSEGIDLAGDRLIGAVIIGAGLPTPTIEREAMSEYYAELYESGREYAYIYPGMNRVMQAAGRVIRRDDDRGVLLLIDDRFKEGVYRKIIPEHWKNLKYTADTRSLGALLEKFWSKM
jgi:Rad3-related DNA helicase